jgi:hypothetical protein
MDHVLRASGLGAAVFEACDISLPVEELAASDSSVRPPELITFAYVVLENCLNLQHGGSLHCCIPICKTTNLDVRKGITPF